MENFKRKEKTYTEDDLNVAKKELIIAGNNLNSFDMNNENIDMKAVVKAKQDWDKSFKKFENIYNQLNSNQIK